MSLLVVGSVALDSVKTPFGEVEEVLGGSAVYFSVAASFFSQVHLVGAVGMDFPKGHLALLRGKGVDLAGLEKAEGETFRWKGEYTYNLNEAITHETRLNVFEDFRPRIPTAYQHCRHLFLANIDPELQLSVLDQVESTDLVACDTMNYWIEGKLDALKETLKRVDILIINDGEARELAQEPNIARAARAILAMGPKTLIVKQGEYGALSFDHETVFSAPGYPLEDIRDPTGAGDTFAGGFMGYLTKAANLSPLTLRQAIIYGSAMASFNVEAFSVDRLKTLTQPEIEERVKAFKLLSHFEIP